MGEESSAYMRSPAWRISELERQLAVARESLRADRAASHVVIEGLRKEKDAAIVRADDLERRLRLVDEYNFRGEPGVAFDPTRPIPFIARDTLYCAEAWHRDACLIGNVRAREIVYLAAWALQAEFKLRHALEHVPEFVGEDDNGAAVFGVLCCPNGEPGHFWKDGCPSRCEDGQRYFEEER